MLIKSLPVMFTEFLNHNNVWQLLKDHCVLTDTWIPRYVCLRWCIQIGGEEYGPAAAVCVCVCVCVYKTISSGHKDRSPYTNQ
jgi:hypothetical protein